MKLRRMRQKRGLAADRLALVLRYCDIQKWTYYAAPGRR